MFTQAGLFARQQNCCYYILFLCCISKIPLTLDLKKKMFYHKEYNEHITEEAINNDRDCLFKSSDFISKPIRSVRCTMDENILQLQYPLSNRNSILAHNIDYNV